MKALILTVCASGVTHRGWDTFSKKGHHAQNASCKTVSNKHGCLLTLPSEIHLSTYSSLSLKSGSVHSSQLLVSPESPA